MTTVRDLSLVVLACDGGLALSGRLRMVLGHPVSPSCCAAFR